MRGMIEIPSRRHSHGRKPTTAYSAWCIVLWLCVQAFPVRADVTIVSNGSANATIVVAADADEVVQDAVADLQSTIQKMSGDTLPIANSMPPSGNMILVGRMPEVDVFLPDLDSMDLGPDGYVIKTIGPAVFVTGQSDGYNSNYHLRIDCGTPNAVYAFLESLGCRWYMSGDDGEVIPSMATIVVPDQDIASKPDLEGRWIGQGGAADMGGEIYADYKTWLGRVRATANAYHEGHQMSSLVPRSLFASHPEYFALVNGVRVNNARVCMANPGTISTATGNLIPFLGQLAWRSYPVGQYDAWNWCEDALCTAQYGDQTFVYATKQQARLTGCAPTNDPLPNVANCNLLFANEIARRVEPSYPNTLITYYAVYLSPGFPEVPARHNVLPMIVHFYAGDEAWRQLSQAWAGISQQLYYLSYMGYRIAMPKFTIVDDIRWCYQQRGIAITFYVVEHSPINMVPLYLASRAMWDTDTTAEDVLLEFYSDFYGAAAVPMQLFYELFHSATLDAVVEWDIHSYYPDTLTAGVVDQCRTMLNLAAGMAVQPVVQRRIASLARYWTATELHVEARDAMVAWRAHRVTETESIARSRINATINYIRSVTDEFWLIARERPLGYWLDELATPAVVDRHVFYNNSTFDGDDPLFNAYDDDAIATDKEAKVLRPGGSCSFTNYTSYDKGINGIMVDIYRAAGTVTADDFEFKVGNISDTSTWAPLTAPSLVSVRPTPGHQNTDRVTVIWPDHSIQNQWLEVTVKSTYATSLSEPEVFYFGNVVGECGDSPASAQVNATDEIGARNNPRNVSNPADITDPYDYNRDGLVNATDEIISRNNPTNFMTGLRLIAP